MSREKEKAVTEDHRALDVRELNRAGLLVAGYSCSWQWMRQGAVAGVIGIHVESLARIRLSYRIINRGQLEEQDYAVCVAWTPCHLGGKRPWFLCPCCGRRVAKLFLRVVFACRYCLRLNYTSQQISKRDRASERSWDLRRALGCHVGFLCAPAECIPKPKGMHWRTFDRKIALLKRVETRALDDAAAMLAIVEDRLDAAARALARG